MILRCHGCFCVSFGLAIDLTRLTRDLVRAKVCDIEYGGDGVGYIKMSMIVTEYK